MIAVACVVVMSIVIRLGVRRRAWPALRPRSWAYASRSVRSARMIARITNQKISPMSTVGASDQIAFSQKSSIWSPEYGGFLGFARARCAPAWGRRAGPSAPRRLTRR